MAQDKPSFQEHIEKAHVLLQGRTAYYNGGQTQRYEPPTPEEVERAKAHALVAQAIVLSWERTGL